MGLLQIGGGVKQKCGGLVVGIDLGTTYSLVARMKDRPDSDLGDDDGAVV